MGGIEGREVLNISQIAGKNPSLTELVGKVVYDDFKKDKAIMINYIEDRNHFVYVGWTGYIVSNGVYSEFIEEAEVCQLKGLSEHLFSPSVDADPRNHSLLSVMSLLKHLERAQEKAA